MTNLEIQRALLDLHQTNQLLQKAIREAIEAVEYTNAAVEELSKAVKMLAGNVQQPDAPKPSTH